MTARVHGDAFATGGLADFAVNVWPEPRPRRLDTALEAALRDERYPDDRAARRAVAARHRRPVEEVLVANGACDALWLIATALRPRPAACVHPSFTEPEAALRAAGAEVTHVAREPAGWTFDPDAVPADAEVVVLGSPNNPTGDLAPPAAVRALLRPGRVVVVDESFMDFVAAETASLAAARLPGLVVVRSLTKLWSLAGVRAGYALGPPELIARLAAHRQPWSVNALACAAIAACAADTETPRAVASAAAAARARLLAGLAALPGVTAWPSAANFVLLAVEDGRAVVARLRAAGVAVRPAASFPGLDERHVRVAVRPGGDVDLLLGALAAALR